MHYLLYLFLIVDVSHIPGSLQETRAGPFLYYWKHQNRRPPEYISWWKTITEATPQGHTSYYHSELQPSR